MRTVFLSNLQWRLVVLLMGFSWGSVAIPAHAQQETAIRAQWTELAKKLHRAGELYREEKFEESATIVREVMGRLPAIPESVDPLTSTMHAKVQKGVDRAKELLQAHQVSVETTPVKAAKETRAGTSFTRDVVPILMKKCGNCHVRATRGKISLATFDALTVADGDKPALVQAGGASDSILIQVIESGKMPKGKLKVTSAELKVLRAWIDEGAASDLTDPTATLDTLN